MSIHSIHSHHPGTGPRLIGRTAERAMLEQLLDDGRAGRSATLVIHGEQGIGKTALIEYVARRATDYQVVRAQGVETEMDLPYAGLHMLCASLSDSLDDVATPQREALEAAVGLRTGPPSDSLQVGLALLTLLSSATAAGPVLCILDDAQWLDRPSAQVLTFVARRLRTESVVILIAQRQHESLDHFACLRELALGRMSDAIMRELFGELMPGRLDQLAIARIIAEARGNPRALTEFLDGVSPADFAGGRCVGVNPRSQDRVSESLQTQLSGLPPDTWQLFVAAAAEPLGDPALLWRAAEVLRIPIDAIAPLENEGLLSIGSRVLFVRPLLRSMVYGIASKDERQRAHRALAAAMAQSPERDRVAWHQAQAVACPDGAIALELERCAETAREHGGGAAAAAFLERAALLTPEPGLRADRSFTAAAAKLDVGDLRTGARLAVTAEMGAIDQRRKDRAKLCRARIASVRGHPSHAPDLLLDAAWQLRSAAPAVAREAQLEALVAALQAGRFGTTKVIEIAAAALAGLAATDPPRAADLLLDALAGRFAHGYPEKRKTLRDALDAVLRQSPGDGTQRWLSLACRFAIDLWDDEAWRAATALQVREARETDLLAILPRALADRALVELSSGDFATASELLDESAAVTARMGTPPLSGAYLVLSAWSGHNSAPAICEAARQEALEHGDGALLCAASYSTAVLHNGHRRYDDALAAAIDAAEFDQPGLCGWALVELIEAAARHARPDVAGPALERLSDQTARVDTDWAAGTEARCRALLCGPDAAEDLYVEAIERLTRSTIKTQLARTQLLYGEWLRRQGRRIEARVPLRAARASFTAMGANSFAKRAHLELLASGEPANSRAADKRTQLTPHEIRVALLARDGFTNLEIGEQLFVSPKTVEYHLRKVFAKVGITSRKELHLVLADIDDTSLKRTHDGTPMWQTSNGAAPDRLQPPVMPGHQ